MQTEDLVTYLNDPTRLNEYSLSELRSLIKKYPYFQLTYLLFLVNLKNIKDPRFDEFLKKYIVFVKDRNLLFRKLNYIESCHQRNLLEKETRESQEQVKDEEIIQSAEEKNVIEKEPDQGGNRQSKTQEEKNKKQQYSRKNLSDRISATLSNQISEADKKEDANEDANSEFFILDKADKVKETKSKDQLSQPERTTDKDQADEQDFEVFELEDKEQQEQSQKSEKKVYYSETYFGEDYLKSIYPRKEEESDDLIDQFIKKNPELEVKKPHESEIEDISEESIQEKEDFLSEKLAHVYLKQGYYEKALQAFEKLSLKYPEKSDYFADQIKKIKQIINEQ